MLPNFTCIPFFYYTCSLQLSLIAMNNTTDWIKNNSNLVFRIVLFLAFFGHGLVSLNFSSSIKLHIALAEVINNLIICIFFDISTQSLVIISGYFDIIISFFILFKIWHRHTLTIAIVYLFIVATSALLFYYNTTGKIFGLAEIMRRFPWIIYSLFLILNHNKYNSENFNLLRLGLAFTFLSHGLASLGIWGLNAGHIELANNILKNQDVSKFIFYSGLFDTAMGIILMIRYKSQLASKISIVWILFIVSISFMTGIPDGIFRLGFLIAAIYISIDERCHTKNILETIQ